MQEFVIEDVPVVEKVAETYNSIEEFFESIKHRHWASHYIKLVVRAKDRVVDSYTEKHHVIPKCLGGANCDENYAILTPEEHYIAHQLLVKLFPSNKKLLFAAVYMTGKSRDLNRSNNKIYSWLKQRMSALQKGVPRPPHVAVNIAIANRKRCLGISLNADQREKISKAGKGRIVGEETRKKLSEINRTPEALERIRKLGASKKGTKLPIEMRIAMSIRRKGVSLTDTHRANMSKARKGVKRPPFSEEWRKNMSIVKKGKAPTWEYTDEIRAKIAHSNRTRPVTDETRAKMSASGKGKHGNTVISSEQRAAIIKSNQTRIVTEETRAKMRQSWEKRRADKAAKEAELLKFSKETDIDWCENE